VYRGCKEREFWKAIPSRQVKGKVTKTEKSVYPRFGRRLKRPGHPQGKEKKVFGAGERKRGPWGSFIIRKGGGGKKEVIVVVRNAFLSFQYGRGKKSFPKGERGGHPSYLEGRLAVRQGKTKESLFLSSQKRESGPQYRKRDRKKNHYRFLMTEEKRTLFPPSSKTFRRDQQQNKLYPVHRGKEGSLRRGKRPAHCVFWKEETSSISSRE